MADRIDMVFTIVQRLEVKVDKLASRLTRQSVKLAALAATVSAVISGAVWILR